MLKARALCTQKMTCKKTDMNSPMRPMQVEFKDPTLPVPARIPQHAKFYEHCEAMADAYLARQQGLKA